MSRAKSCACNWEYVGASLGSVWFRGRLQRFVAVRPDGSVVGAKYRSRGSAILALVLDARAREGLGKLLHLETAKARDAVSGGFLGILTRAGLLSN